MLEPIELNLEAVVQISFLMPAYNSGKFLKKAISSTLGILEQGDELIVIDDASTDETAGISSQWGDSRIKYFRNEKNLGVARSLNLGLSKAKNEYIARIDADDLCLPWRRFLQTSIQRRTDSDLLFSSALLLFSRYKLLVPQKFSPISSEEVGEALKKGNPFVHSTLLARKSSMEQLGGYRDLASEDFDLWLRASKAGLKIVKGNFPTVIHRIHQSQITKTKAWKHRNDAEVALLGKAS